MFRKIVSQLSFSPALVGQLGFYARRLKREQVTRRLGLVFVALALVVQSLVVFQPPESANASNPGDMIPGGLGLGTARSLDNFLGPYDRNERNLQDVFTYFGITRDEITSTSFGQFTVGSRIGWGYENRSGATPVAITNSDDAVVTTVYGRPLSYVAQPGDQIWGYIGHSTKIGWFAIMQYCGNLITDVYPTPPPPKPTPANIQTNKTSKNVTQGNVDATKTTAKVNDRVSFTVTAQNTGGTAAPITMSDNLKSVLGYASLVDDGGGTLNASTKVLSWPAETVNPGATISKTFTVQMKSSLESATTECEMKNAYFSTVLTIPVGCTTPPAKLELSKDAKNLTQGNVNATTVTAKENDRISFTLNVKNTGGTAKTFTFVDNVGDTLEYSQLLDRGAGVYDADARTLTWPEVTIQPGETATRVFTVQVLSEIPVTSKGQSDASSYNCKIENTFYESSVIIPVTCSTPKAVEQIVAELPTTGPTENLIFAGVLLTIVTYFFFRSKQLGREVRLIRRDLNAGTI